jgi:hypothetical protein
MGYIPSLSYSATNPEFLKHRLSFIYLSYSMMAILFRTAPMFEILGSNALGILEARDLESYTYIPRYRKSEPHRQ